MLRQYLRSAFRNLVRNKRSSVINVSGLAIGIAASLLIYLVVSYELGYDRFRPGYDNIYHIAIEDKRPDGSEFQPGTPNPFLETAKALFPEASVGVLHSGGEQLAVLSADGTTSPEKRFKETGVFFADSSLFDVFTVTWLAGTPAVLSRPGVIVLSEKIAARYFGDWKSAVGGWLKMDNINTMQVAGVIANTPLNSDFPLNAVASYETYRKSPFYGYSPEWGNTSSSQQVFLRVPASMAPATVTARLNRFSAERNKDRKNGQGRFYFLQPLSEIHFDKRMGNFGDHTTARATLWTLTLIAVFIMVMACINFINLSTVQAVNRSKEIGVRKVLGSKRTDLLGQLLGETALVVVAALLLAFCLATACLPFIKNIVSIEEPLPVLSAQTALFLSGLFLAVTLLAGLYPAVVVSGFRPVLALKNKITSASVGGIPLRRSLVVIQFALSQVLIVGTIVAVSQMNHVSHADLGLNKDAVLVINGNGDSTQLSRFSAFREELRGVPSVKSVTLCSDVPTSENNWGTDMAYDHRPDESFPLFIKFADPDYFKTFGLTFAAGGPQSLSDTIRDVVVNETLLKKLRITPAAAAIGKDLRLGGQWRKIVGVVKDFRTNSLREATRPVVIAASKKDYSVTALKLHGADLAATQAQVQKVWDRLFPEYAATVYFLDEKIAAFYNQEKQLELLYKIFAGIAVFLSCLGLYGLVSFMAVQRRREVGIRKVLGAGVGQIIYLFSKEFTVLVVIAFSIAAPVGWYMMSQWLGHFADRIALSPLLFLAGGLVSIAIAWLTVGYKSYRAAMVNPVNSIKSE